MNLLELNKKFGIIEFSKLEIEIISNALNQVCILLSKREFGTRTGVSFEYAQSFLKNINDLKKKSEKNFTIMLEQKDFEIINSVLNEICHGLKIDNFSKQIGFNKDLVKQVFTSFHPICIDYRKKIMN